MWTTKASVSRVPRKYADGLGRDGRCRRSWNASNFCPAIMMMRQSDNSMVQGDQVYG